MAIYYAFSAKWKRFEIKRTKTKFHQEKISYRIGLKIRLNAKAFNSPNLLLRNIITTRFKLLKILRWLYSFPFMYLTTIHKFRDHDMKKIFHLHGKLNALYQILYVEHDTFSCPHNAAKTNHQWPELSLWNIRISFCVW